MDDRVDDPPVGTGAAGSPGSAGAPPRPSPLPGEPVPGQPVAYDPYAWGRPPRPPSPSPAWMELPPDPAPQWGIGDAVVGLLAWFAASILFALPGILAAYRDAEPGDPIEITGLWSVLAVAGAWSGFLVVLLYASRRRGYGTFARDFGFRFRWIDPVIGFGVGFATLLVLGIASVTLAEVFGEEPSGNTEAIFGGQEANPIGLIALAAAAAIGAPIVEELFFRGLALRAIERRFGAVAGVIGSTVLFTLPHFQGGSAFGAVLLLGVIGGYAVVLALLTRAMRRLGPAIFAHMTINGIEVALLVYVELAP